ncbi:hypothetical protein BT93_A1718 [Corymbia citriodora subsp. variegata]|nr:hypothetical protein BT93_A1718 [Corymbia citriodora subsp. variegata]
MLPRHNIPKAKASSVSLKPKASSASGCSSSDHGNRKRAFGFFRHEFRMSKEGKSIMKKAAKKAVEKAVNQKWSSMSEEKKQTYDDKVVENDLELEKCCEKYKKLIQDFGLAAGMWEEMENVY